MDSEVGTNCAGLELERLNAAQNSSQIIHLISSHLSLIPPFLLIFSEKQDALESGLIISILVCGIQAQQGSDMSDEEFKKYAKANHEILKDLAKPAAKGCLAGAAGGWAGCAGGAGLNVIDHVVLEKKWEDPKLPPQEKKENLSRRQRRIQEDKRNARR